MAAPTQEQLSGEVQWRSSRAGGKGGQNVNKVETAVEALWYPAASALLTDAEKSLLHAHLANRLHKDGCLSVRASATRSQLENKALALGKLQKLVAGALVVPEERRKTRPSRAARQRRIDDKKHHAFRKEQRRRDWD